MVGFGGGGAREIKWLQKGGSQKKEEKKGASSEKKAMKKWYKVFIN